MDNKKPQFHQQTTPGSINSEHQHNTAPQHLRLLQYGLKIPNQQQQQHVQHLQHLQHLQHMHAHRPEINIHSNPQFYMQKIPPLATSYQQISLNQQNVPQIWVPHQPPIHYHQQQQFPTKPDPKPLPEPKPKIFNNASSNSPAEKKKSNTNQQLRSPSAKRPLEAPVSMQGWLHKQGSEGLMLWKRRWFVLSEYCLFYYKGPEEEKLLGSILLPSYKVSTCSVEDKVHKKHAFKLEHANMRTYMLSADNSDLMQQWIKLLNLACNLQSNESQTIVQNVPNADYVHSHTSSDLSDFNQHLYANAPPKPRRLTDGYQSNSPDVLSLRQLTKSPVIMHECSERRTPDTYGRSQLFRKPDYEDIHTMYKRPLSPLNHTNVVRRPQTISYRTYTPVNMYQSVKPPTSIARPHSADFLDYEHNHRHVNNTTRPKSSLDLNLRQDNDGYYSEQRYAENMRKSAQYLQKQPVKLSTNIQPARSRSVLSEGSLSKELDMDLSSQHMYNYNDNSRNYEQFTRSASARLEGDPRKREESMRRLLEWKQRMLQSPLNRKVQSTKLYPTQDYYADSSKIDGRRSVTNLQQYNSYSSDDEASGSISLNRDTFPRAQNTRKELEHSKTVSAGELLGRTHEELVLLLIQLRRQSAQTLQAVENCYNEIDSIQAQSHFFDNQQRLDNLAKLEQLKQHLLDLEKQYEKGKPLVNLVDNMVKLGSLYRQPQLEQHTNPFLKQRLDFNQQMQEKRLLEEEQRDWNRTTPNHYQLQQKVQQLYQLDKLIHEESNTLQNLQQDKEDIEQALNTLRLKLNKPLNPSEVEETRKQQILLETDLSRVHYMLAQNSKKLEETVAGNARLEQELLVLKQKLQLSKQQQQQRQSPQFVSNNDSLPCVLGSNNLLESDLHRVQQKIGNLQKQRLELSLQVRQLTDRNKKKITSYWRETDLDTMSIIDHDGWDLNPMYINTEIQKTNDDQIQDLPEKQEIKTVRIVKRESERRQRDRDKTIGKYDALVEEDDSSTSSSLLFHPTAIIKTIDSDNMNTTSDLSPVFKSEAARQIITEMSNVQPNRRAVPKERRRHYTAPNNDLIMKNFVEDSNKHDLLSKRRARDDLDMERALRQKCDAPDIVRSTLSSKDVKYNESTIDNLLGTPNKISIPERYIPEQLPQLSVEEQEHRLKKVESIKKMLSTNIIGPSNSNLDISDGALNLLSHKSSTTSKMIEEKKQREHLLQLNQILAKQVMEMSKIVADHLEKHLTDCLL